MNEITIRQWYHVFKDDRQLVEIRVIGKTKGKTYSGYFKSADDIVAALRPYENYNCYFTLNRPKDACYSRSQHDRIELTNVTTSDDDIVGRDWVLIDIDVEKPSDTNSTDDEKEKAKSVVNGVWKFLRDNGFSIPVLCDSANGYHILLKTNMANDSESRAIVKDFLQVLDMFFSTDEVKVDTTTFNAARICKLYGTSSRKGTHTSERPQRESSIIRVPDPVEPTQKEYFKKIADMLPKPTAESYSRGVHSEFDIDGFISEHGIKVVRNTVVGGTRKIVLEECPFNSNHKDAAIFVMGNGAMAFKCFHNSCSTYRFKDFRLHYDPNAYNKREYREHLDRKRFNSPELYRKEFTPKTEDKGKEEGLGEKLIEFADVNDIDLSQLEAIPTGIGAIDRKTKGLILGNVTILTGLNGSGKSTLINGLLLNAAQTGYKSILWSGELTPELEKQWIVLQAAGREYVEEVGEGFFRVRKQYIPHIAEWMRGKISLYNNNYGNKYEQISNDIDHFAKDGTKLIILDNMMSMDISGLEGDRNEKQKNFIVGLTQIAKKRNVHIIAVCHPRKETSFIRKESISGSANITDAADNVIVIHRVNDDFVKRAGEFWKQDRIGALACYDNVVEVLKNRIYGTMDMTVGLYFEKETKRMKNEIGEYVHYGWEERIHHIQTTLRLEPNRSGFDYNDEYDYSTQFPY